MNQSISTVEIPLSEYPAILAGDNNVFQIIANCYALCDKYWIKFSNVHRTRADLSSLFDKVRAVFVDLLKAQSVEESRFLLRETSAIRDQLNANSFDELLVRAAALLRAAAWHVERFPAAALRTGNIEKQAAKNLGGKKYLFIGKVDNPILAQVSEVPRDEDSISETISRYHLPLEITPRSVGQFEIVRKSLSVETSCLLKRRLKSGSLKIAAAPLNADVHPKLDFLPDFPADKPKRFFLKSITTKQSQRDYMEKVLAECRDQSISVLVLPELRMPPFLRDHVVAELRKQKWDDLEKGKGLVLVVCGSWHVQEDGDYVNRCSVRDHQGNEVWTHDKLAEFNITEENVAQSDFLKASGFDATGGVEGIRSGTRLEICDCALGRVAVAICVGFFHRPLEDLLVKSGATLFLVPAMSPDLERMHERAHALVGSQHAAVVVANCAKAGQGKDKGRSFYLLPETNAQPVPIENNQKLLVLKIKRPRSRITTPLTIN